MRRKATALALISVFFLVLAMSTSAVWAQKLYDISWEDVLAVKPNFDDPTPLYQELPQSKVLPKEVWERINYDREAMKSLWAGVVGFKAPDVVGKIAPEIKPGKYTYQDKEKYPFKDLMIPEMYARFAPGGPPLTANFPEITVVPTKQYYVALPYAQKTKEYMGAVKQHDDGYLNYDTYEAGFPFPQPSGPFMAQQIMYNHEKRYANGESYHMLINNLGYNSRFEQDLNSLIEMYSLRVEGRCLFEPLGYFDERAKKEGESKMNVIQWWSPRDLFGMAYLNITYEDPEKQHLNMMYIPAIRRVRRMSGTDVQDPLGGQDMCADDGDLFNQKLSRTRYPYEYKVVGEREYLYPFATTVGSGYLSSKGLEWHDYEFERRPMHVVELKQEDPNYIYSRRVLYFDKELLALCMGVYFDQKGRLYRTLDERRYFQPESGLDYMNDTAYLDHIDFHSTLQHAYFVPDPSIDRGYFSLKKLIRLK